MAKSVVRKSQRAGALVMVGLAGPRRRSVTAGGRPLLAAHRRPGHQPAHARPLGLGRPRHVRRRDGRRLLRQGVRLDVRDVRWRGRPRDVHARAGRRPADRRHGLRRSRHEGRDAVRPLDRPRLRRRIPRPSPSSVTQHGGKVVYAPVHARRAWRDGRVPRSGRHAVRRREVEERRPAPITSATWASGRGSTSGRTTSTRPRSSIAR